MSKKRRGHRAAILLLLLPLLTAGLRPGTPSPSVEKNRNAGEVYVALGNFLTWSCDARSEELDERARHFNAVQIPLAAAAIDQAERMLQVHDETAYRAFVRWQFWLSKHLDPQNRGIWEAERDALRTPHELTRATTAVLPALEMTQLESLAGMALRRGHVFDALIWWRDHDLLERKIAHDLYDPVSGGYAQYDSLGRRQQHPADLADLLPIGLNAPTDRGAARILALDLLVGGSIEGPHDGRARAWMSQTLNPVSGWPRQAGLDLLTPAQDAILLSRAVALLQQPKLGSMVEETLRELGLPDRGPLTLDLGSQEVLVPAPSPTLHQLERSRVAVEFLRRSRVLEPREADDALLILKEAAKQLPQGRDETARILMEWADQWSRLDPIERQNRQALRSGMPPLNGDENASAFAYQDRDVVEWLPTAIDLLRRDAAGLLHCSRRDAPYTARVEPGVVARDQAPRVHIHYLRVSAAERGRQGEWTAAWTDGRTILDPVPIHPRQQGTLDSFAELPPLPPERGLWWLIVRGPEGAPDHAPACALVDPMRAVVQALPFGDDHSRLFELSVENALAEELEGRYEVVTSSGWQVDPEPALNFTLAPRETRVWRIEIAAPEDDPPGLYPVQWRFFDGTRMVSILDDQVAVHFRWLAIGPFAPGRSSPLAGQNAPESQVRLGQDYTGWHDKVRWHHLPQDALSSEGWVELGDGEPGAVWYGLTAVSTTTGIATVRLDSPTPALLKLNGQEVGRIRGRRKFMESSLNLGSGANYLLVKVVADEEGHARIRLDLKTTEGQPLRSADYRIEHLLDGYGYVADAPNAENPPSTPEGQARQQMRLVSISYQDPAAHSVSVVGNFNGWSPRANPLHRSEDGIWRGEIRLHPGEFQYKLVIDGKRWIADPRNPAQVDDGFGAVNSVLVVR